MAGLLLIHYETEDASRSPELRYLASCVRTDTRRVFGEVTEIRWNPASDRPPAPSGDAAVLVIGKENVHLGERSLRSMKEALDVGAGAVLPGRLASFPLAREAPIYTLRAFEDAERRILDEGHEPLERRDSHLPVTLFSAEVFDAKLREVPLAELLTETELLARLSLGDGIARAGVFHDYVDYYGEAREDVLPFVPEGTRDVLEIGCGRGLTGRLLRERLGCRVTGVELNEEVAKEAEGHLDRVIVGNVEDLELEDFEREDPELAGGFDAVVATELFEHLNYPEGFLVKMKGLLRPGGRIVLSVPNVGHYSIVEDLLAGRWDYLPIGLLCYTHFRFFTRATLEAWIERVGFAAHEIVAQTTELPERFEKMAGFETDRESLATKGFYVVLAA